MSAITTRRTRNNPPKDQKPKAPKAETPKAPKVDPPKPEAEKPEAEKPVETYVSSLTKALGESDLSLAEGTTVQDIERMVLEAVPVAEDMREKEKAYQGAVEALARRVFGILQHFLLPNGHPDWARTDSVTKSDAIGPIIDAVKRPNEKRETTLFRLNKGLQRYRDQFIAEYARTSADIDLSNEAVKQIVSEGPASRKKARKRDADPRLKDLVKAIDAEWASIPELKGQKPHNPLDEKPEKGGGSTAEARESDQLIRNRKILATLISEKKVTGYEAAVDLLATAQAMANRFDGKKDPTGFGKGRDKMVAVLEMVTLVLDGVKARNSDMLLTQAQQETYNKVRNLNVK